MGISYSNCFRKAGFEEVSSNDIEEDYDPFRDIEEDDDPFRDIELANN